jgi:site-specific DNA-methyltransferase (adenine-specific)
VVRWFDLLAANHQKSKENGQMNHINQTIKPPKQRPVQESTSENLDSKPRKTAIFPHHLNAQRYKQQFEYMFVFTKGVIKTYNPIHDIPNESAGKTLFIRKKIKTSDNGRYNGKTKSLKISDFRMRDNVWREGRAGYEGHPAPFPEKLAYDHIVSWSNKGDLVLDPFAGSGTVGKVSQELGRDCILIEKEPKYVDIIMKRLRSRTL